MKKYLQPLLVQLCAIKIKKTFPDLQQPMRYIFLAFPRLSTRIG